jgi:hypothetical protein
MKRTAADLAEVRAVVNAFSRQAFRVDRAQPAIARAAAQRLTHRRAAMAVEVLVAKQTERILRGVIEVYETARQARRKLPQDALALLRDTTGTAARNPPSFADRLRQLDEHEKTTGGTPFWQSHDGQVRVSTDHVHTRLAGPLFSDPSSYELLGFRPSEAGVARLRCGLRRLPRRV